MNFSISSCCIDFSRKSTLPLQFSKFTGVQLDSPSGKVPGHSRQKMGQPQGLSLFPASQSLLLFEIHVFGSVVCFRQECQSKSCYSISTRSTIVRKLYLNQSPAECIQRQTCLGLALLLLYILRLVSNLEHSNIFKHNRHIAQ